MRNCASRVCAVSVSIVARSSQYSYLSVMCSREALGLIRPGGTNSAVNEGGTTIWLLSSDMLRFSHAADGRADGSKLSDDGD